MKRGDIVQGKVYHDLKSKYRLITQDKGVALSRNQMDCDLVAFRNVRMPASGKLKKSQEKLPAPLTSCTRTSFASWAKAEVPVSDLPPIIKAAFGL